MLDFDRSAIMVPRRRRSIFCVDGNCFIMHIWIAIVFDIGMHRISASGNHWLIDWLNSCVQEGMLSEYKTS